MSQTLSDNNNMYLALDPLRNPVSTFDDFEDAVACVCEWTQRSARYSVVERVCSLGFEVRDSDTKEKLGYIQEGILHNPSVIHY